MRLSAACSQGADPRSMWVRETPWLQEPHGGGGDQGWSFRRWRGQGPEGRGSGDDLRIGEKAHLETGTAQIRTAGWDQAGCSCRGKGGGKGPAHTTGAGVCVGMRRNQAGHKGCICARDRFWEAVVTFWSGAAILAVLPPGSWGPHPEQQGSAWFLPGARSSGCRVCLTQREHCVRGVARVPTKDPLKPAPGRRGHLPRCPPPGHLRPGPRLLSRPWSAPPAPSEFCPLGRPDPGLLPLVYLAMSKHLIILDLSRTEPRGSVEGGTMADCREGLLITRHACTPPPPVLQQRAVSLARDRDSDGARAGHPTRGCGRL